MLTQEAHRDADTWGIYALDLVKQNFNPERVIADDGSGLRAGLKLAFPNLPCDGDHFHLLQVLINLRRYFRNRLKSRVSYLKSIQDKMAGSAPTIRYEMYNFILQEFKNLAERHSHRIK